MNKISKKDKYLTGAKIAVSAVCRSYKELESEYAHAEFALKFLNSDSSVNDYNSLGVYKIFSEVKDKTVLENFYREVLGKLDSLGKDKRDDFLETLKLYVSYGGRIQKTAEGIFTHRNTINYRIRRISEILGVDMQDSEAMYKIMTALHVKDMLDEM